VLRLHADRGELVDDQAKRGDPGQDQANEPARVDNLVRCSTHSNEIVWRDDKQVVSCRVAKIYSEKPCLRVEVRAAA